MSDLRKIYEKIKVNNPNINDNVAKQKAWVMRDRLMFQNSGGGLKPKFNNNYIDDDYIDDYFE
jgi:hypothetical protein